MLLGRSSDGERGSAFEEQAWAAGLQFVEECVERPTDPEVLFDVLTLPSQNVSLSKQFCDFRNRFVSNHSETKNAIVKSATVPVPGHRPASASIRLQAAGSLCHSCSERRSHGSDPCDR